MEPILRLAGHVANRLAVRSHLAKAGNISWEKGASAWYFCLSPLYVQPTEYSRPYWQRDKPVAWSRESERGIPPFTHSRTNNERRNASGKACAASCQTATWRAAGRSLPLPPSPGRTEGRRENKVRGEERADGMRGPLSPSLSLRRPSATSTSRNFPAGGDGGEGQQSIQQTVPDDRRPSTSTSSSTLPMSPVSSRRGPL